jgi:FAD/FMN-containing dehydrogenase
MIDPAYVDPELTASEYPRLIWRDTYPRLQALKRHYDPSNVFRFPQSVRADQYVSSQMDPE